MEALEKRVQELEKKVSDLEEKYQRYLLLKDKLIKSDFIIDDNNFDLGIAIGGDGSFLRMIKNTKFDSGEENLDNYGKINTRRTTPVKANTAPSGRRYKPVTKNE